MVERIYDQTGKPAQRQNTISLDCLSVHGAIVYIYKVIVSK